MDGLAKRNWFPWKLYLIVFAVAFVISIVFSPLTAFLYVTFIILAFRWGLTYLLRKSMGVPNISTHSGLTLMATVANSTDDIVTIPIEMSNSALNKVILEGQISDYSNQEFPNGESITKFTIGSDKAEFTLRPPDFKDDSEKLGSKTIWVSLDMPGKGRVAGEVTDISWAITPRKKYVKTQQTAR